ncbi:MAG: 5-formyltetrahydrofolate cyclo-ligase [Paracoccaceae bacterium]
MVEVQDIKAEVRKAAFAARRAARDSAPGAGEVLRDHLMASRLLTGMSVIAGYRPIRTEIDPTPLMNALHSAGHGLAVPVILGEGQPLEFHAWTPDTPMHAGPFGADVPVNGVAVIPDLILAPLLAFDRRGYRLGYGGGFYDRTLELLRTQGRLCAIGLAYAGQEISQVPTEPTDQPLDAILTEQGLMSVREAA